MKKQLCFIGAGKHATANIYPAAILAGAEICAIATHSDLRSADALRRFGSAGNAYHDYRDMLREESCPNVVVVTQAKDAPTIIADCLAAGKHVFTEKPLGLSAAQASHVAGLAQSADTFVMVGFMKRYAPVYIRLKQLIDSCELGVVKSFRAQFSVDATSWNSSENGFLFQAAIHYIDLIRSLFGEVADIAGFHNVVNGCISQSFSVQCENGVVGSISFESQPAWSREYESLGVTFANGFAQTENLSRLTIHRAALSPTASSDTVSSSVSLPVLPWQDLTEHDEVFLPNASPASGNTRDLYLRGFVGELNHFLDCCQTKRLPYSNAGDNVNTTMLCERLLTTFHISEVPL